ncbi:hypothetical protein AB0G54_29005 [Streptomyces yokosukanensis]|uniref:hypothetical protein n=1 Tax=Streptomyces yokosukanensis TaxID=67386 RepID=UPI000B1F0E4D|nr:hypothetical protein [Streptomyces yokosukanensis]
MTVCTASPADTAFSARPRLVPLVATVAIGGENHVIGADRETALSVMCNLPDFKMNSGRVTVTVMRAHATATEHVDLMVKHPKSRPTCH